MTKMPVLSGREIIKLLSKNGFVVVGQKGSHIRLKKTAENGVFVTVVPDKKDIPVGTLKSIIRQSGLSEEEFRK